jgi:hypothetical protein
MPLFRLSFDHRDDFNLGRLRSGPIARLGREMPRRLPLLTPQTFFAEPGLGRADWRKILNNLAAIEIPSAEIIEASLSDTSVTLSLDIERPSLPQQWVKLEKKDRRWTITQAVEFRAEFPRPAVWWSFLPLLPATDSSARNPFPNSKLPAGIRDSITSLVSRLRGVGEIVELDSTDRNQTILVHTSYLPTHSYKLLFTREQGNWRLFSVHYSNDR